MHKFIKKYSSLIVTIFYLGKFPYAPGTIGSIFSFFLIIILYQFINYLIFILIFFILLFLAYNFIKFYITDLDQKLPTFQLNLDSKRAARRLGFKFEGVFRQSFIVKKRNRDTAWFSIIDKEWKKYKKNYRKYLKKLNFDQQLNQKKKLKL